MAKYYLAGPFWDEGCQEFFSKFIERINETRMDNSSYINDKLDKSNLNDINSEDLRPEELVVSMDQFFAPGHFKVDFQKIRSEYSTSDLERTLKQVLELDLKQIDSCDSMVAYVKDKLDLGTLVEIGYFISGLSFSDMSKALYYNTVKKYLILEGNNQKLNDSIDAFLDIIKYSMSNFRSDENCKSIYVIDGIDSIKNWNYNRKNKEFSLAAIRLGNFEEPINAMAAGLLYKYGIPFVTYTTDESVKNNVMMIAASLGHINLNSSKLDKVEKSVLSWIDNAKDRVWSNDSIESSKEIK